MTRRLRNLVLTAHITFSVGWIGAVAVFLAFAIAGLTSHDTQTIRTAFWAMEVTARSIIVPLAFASLLSGLIQSFGTPWGLFQHYWVLVKFLLTMLATVVLLLKMPLIGDAARRAAETTVSTADFRMVAIQLVVHAAGGLLVLLVVTSLSIYKPWGLTRYGQRKKLEGRNEPLRSAKMVGAKAMSDSENRVVAGVPFRGAKMYLATGLGVLFVAVHILMHITGHRLHHGH